jgi:hypothetical protein
VEGEANDKVDCEQLHYPVQLGPTQLGPLPTVEMEGNNTADFIVTDSDLTAAALSALSGNSAALTAAVDDATPTSFLRSNFGEAVLTSACMGKQKIPGGMDMAIKPINHCQNCNRLSIQCVGAIFVTVASILCVPLNRLLLVPRPSTHARIVTEGPKEEREQ